MAKGSLKEESKASATRQIMAGIDAVTSEAAGVDPDDVRDLLFRISEQLRRIADVCERLETPLTNFLSRQPHL